MDKDLLLQELRVIGESMQEVKTLLEKLCRLEEEHLIMQKDLDREILTVSEAAKWTSLSKDSINYYVQNGLIPHKKIGKHTRFSKSVLRKWIEDDMNTAVSNLRRNKS